MGVKKGVPDLCLPVARGRYHGLYIELKTPTGRERLNAEGCFAEICHGWESAAKVLAWYLGLGKEE